MCTAPCVCLCQPGPPQLLSTLGHRWPLALTTSDLDVCVAPSHPRGRPLPLVVMLTAAVQQQLRPCSLGTILVSSTLYRKCPRQIATPLFLTKCLYYCTIPSPSRVRRHLPARVLGGGACQGPFLPVGGWMPALEGWGGRLPSDACLLCHSSFHAYLQVTFGDYHIKR